MLSGGDGGLTMGPLQMDQYYILNKGLPYASIEEAKKFIQVMKNSFYGAKDITPVVSPNTEFQITESEGGFYVWYKPC